MKTKRLFKNFPACFVILIALAVAIYPALSYASNSQKRVAQNGIVAASNANASSAAAQSCPDNSLICAQNYQQGFSAENLIYIFLALVLWTITPAGILFFGAYTVFLSRESSGLKKKIAWLVQIFALLFWASLMSILLLVYLDSMTYNALNMGGRPLNIAITSGIAFVVVMLLIMLIERKQEEREASFKKSGKNREKMSGARKYFGNFGKDGGGERPEKEEPQDFGERIKEMLKKDVKEIIDEAIDKWL